MAAGGRQLWPIVWRLAGLVVLILLANQASGWLIELLKMELTPKTEPMIHRIIMAVVVVYALLIAVPFVPAMEIGIALMVLVGPGIAPLVYLATVLGLFVSFLIGSFVPQPWLQAALRFLLLERASRLVGELEPLSRKDRLAALTSRAPRRFVPLLLRHRYIAVALALNTPGNALIGGGGGISLVAGLSKLYTPLGYLVTLALAVAPVPLAVLIFGQEVFS